jgi:conjugative relaxase-like TrwC/TraI family protein
VLSIGKLGKGAEGYYLQAVASGVEDYYLGSGEAPGRWIGDGSGRLGLSGVVVADDLRAVLDGRDPATGRSMIAVRRPDRLPGFDLTFSAPKSVSLLFALSEEKTSLAVRRAHDAAVAQALGYLEREAGEVRRGRDGVDRLPGGGFVAAAFRHRSSRAGDPQLHTHVLVANMTRGADGRWSALDGRQIYLQAKTAGTLYQTALRYELRRLGLEFVLRPNGTCEIGGVPGDMLRAFSRRRAEIEAHLADRGETSRRAAEVAALATRKAKDYGVHPESLAAEWHARADRLGFNARARAALLGRTSPLPPSPEVLTRATGQLLGPAGLTTRLPVFDRRDALRGWCAQLPAGAPVITVERLADQLLAHPDVVPVDQTANPPRPGAERSFARHTTTEMLALEQAVIDAASRRRDAKVAIADATAVEEALAARPTLSAEQTAMVRRLTQSGAGVEVVVGKAGSGKSHALAAARQAWRASGTPVLGAAVAARAAIALSEAAGMPAMTVARLLTELQRTGQRAGQATGQGAGQPGGQDLGQSSGLPRGAVLVVDEAGMLGTRDLARLLAAAEHAQGKLVLVGDHRQLPELAAGGAFRALARRLDPAVLRQNRRQVEPWERDALDRLRAGQVQEAIDAYLAAGRVTIAGTGDQQRAALVAAWWAQEQPHLASHSTAAEGTVMLAARRADVAELNDRARALMAAAGRLTGPTLGVHLNDGALRSFAVGDVVIARRNDYRAGLFNGQRGRVIHVDPVRGTLTVRTSHADVTVGRGYLAHGGLDHGYALTIHQAQGLTATRGLVLGTDSLYRESAYVALSRGRSRNELYTATRPDNLDPAAVELHVPQNQEPKTDDPVTKLAQSLQRSRGQTMAIDLLAANRARPCNEPDRSL